MLLRQLLFAFMVSGVVPAAAEPVSLLVDPDFSRGLTVNAPAPGKHVPVGRLLAPGSASRREPAWDLAQWHSRFTLANAEIERLPGGSLRYNDQSKTVILGASDSENADLVLAIDTRKEYRDGPRKKGDAWPHLLVEQRMRSHPRLDTLERIDFAVDCKLRRAEKFTPDGYTPKLHAAQFLIYFTVQNQNPDSPGHGDFLWLGVNVYDDRGRPHKKVHAGDVALNKLVYHPERSAYTGDPQTVGQWMHFEADLLPLAKQALQEAWNRNKLTASQNLHDYALGGMNIGWEVPGIFNVSMQIKDLSVSAFLR